MDLTRRDLLRSLGLLIAGGGIVGGKCVSGPFGRESSDAGRIPLIHITDLYHPPQDPDDQIDLATVLALEEYDLRGVVLDITQPFLQEAPEGFDITRDPGHVPVAQMAHITGRSIPAAQGPIHPLTHPRDTCQNAPPEEQSGIGMILNLLAESPDPLKISVTGSPRALTAAYNRDPALLEEKTRAVLLNAGSTGGPKKEWNVQLDPNAYIGLWESRLPIHWFPPGTDSGAFDPAHERGTFWRAGHADLFRDLPPKLQKYFSYALSGSSEADIIKALTKPGEGEDWQAILVGERNLWSTASLVMEAGRSLVKTDGGWKFLPSSESKGLEMWPWRLDPIQGEVNEDAVVTWQLVGTESHRRIFGRKPGPEFSTAMTEALNALLRVMPLPANQ